MPILLREYDLFVFSRMHGRSSGLHDVYVLLLGGSRDMLPWINKTK